MIGVEKAAILLTTLGPEAAAAVFRHLSEPEVRQVSAAIARLRSIPREQAAAVHEEAWRRLTEREGLLIDGERFARQMIAAALTGPRAERPADKAAQSGAEFLAASLDPVAPAALGTWLPALLMRLFAVGLVAAGFFYVVRPLVLGLATRGGEGRAARLVREWLHESAPAVEG